MCSHVIAAGSSCLPSKIHFWYYYSRFWVLDSFVGGGLFCITSYIVCDHLFLVAIGESNLSQVSETDPLTDENSLGNTMVSIIYSTR